MFRQVENIFNRKERFKIFAFNTVSFSVSLNGEKTTKS